MLTAQAVGTDGNLLLLLRSTAFNLTFEESINTTQLDRAVVQECNRGNIITKYEIIYLRGKSLNSFWHFQKTHISLSWWRRFLPLKSGIKEFSFFFRQIKITDKVINIALS